MVLKVVRGGLNSPDCGSRGFLVLGLALFVSLVGSRWFWSWVYRVLGGCAGSVCGTRGFSIVVDGFGGSSGTF